VRGHRGSRRLQTQPLEAKVWQTDAAKPVERGDLKGAQITSMSASRPTPSKVTAGNTTTRLSLEREVEAAVVLSRYTDSQHKQNS